MEMLTIHQPVGISDADHVKKFMLDNSAHISFTSIIIYPMSTESIKFKMLSSAIISIIGSFLNSRPQGVLGGQFSCYQHWGGKHRRGWCPLCRSSKEAWTDLRRQGRYMEEHLCSIEWRQWAQLDNFAEIIENQETAALAKLRKNLFEASNANRFKPKRAWPLRSETGLMMTIPWAMSSQCLGSWCSIASWWMGRRGRVGLGPMTFGKEDSWEIWLDQWQAEYEREQTPEMLAAAIKDWNFLAPTFSPLHSI